MIGQGFYRISYPLYRYHVKSKQIARIVDRKPILCYSSDE